MRKKKKLKYSYFTLIEIMIVVGIIMLLAGVAIPIAMKQLGKGQRAAAVMQIEGFDNAIIQFQIDTGKIPKDLNELVSNPGNQKWKGPYLKKKEIPKDPWGNDYVYESGTGISGYKITCYGSDGTAGGADQAEDITNE